MRKIMRMSEEIGEDELEKYEDLANELEGAFTDLMRHSRQEAATDES